MSGAVTSPDEVSQCWYGTGDEVGLAIVGWGEKLCISPNALRRMLGAGRDLMSSTSRLWDGAGDE